MRTTTGLALSLLVCSALLSGCGDDEKSPGDGPSASPTSVSPSPSGSEPGESTVEPASGAQVELGSLTVSYPEGFEPRESEAMGAELVTATGPDGERVGLSAYEDFSHESLAKAVDLAITTGLWTSEPERLDDLDVDGVPMYHLSGPDGAGATLEQFGAEFGGYDMTLTVSTEGSAAERQALIDSILATASWKEEGA